MQCVTASGDTSADALGEGVIFGDHPLGAFDPQSIMSYCRTDPSATLTDEDVTQATAVYRSNAPPYTPPFVYTSEPIVPPADTGGCSL